MVKLEIRKLPGSPLWEARMEDWIENGDRILRLHEEHEEQYRRKICSKCSPGQRIRRDCTSLIPDCDELSCDHMKRAFARKHGRLIHQHAELHPWSVSLRLNAELEARRRAGRVGA
ncbi:MAG: hypothetical protein OXU37_07835 [Thaumarchaeota archaeon]|nr:hypothetical protein [Nitrososphaerota archaeon]